jgi:dethiobiotin synthetase
MSRGLFVTGTDTGVGKTVVSAACLHRYANGGSLRYWKPVQTGIEQDDDTASVVVLSGCGNDVVLDAGVRLPHPVSPHLAARIAGEAIRIPALVDRFGREADAAWVVEGAGGVLVPLDDTVTMTVLMQALALPVLVVSRSGLGTINHTLLTIEALRARRLRVAGVVMVGSPDQENRAAIERHGRVAVLGSLPLLEPLTADRLGAWARQELDPEGELDDCFV